MLKYTNGVGHLLMSIFLTLVGLALILVPGVNQAAQGVGIGLILAVQSAWFIPGAARIAVHEMSNQLQAPPAPAPAPAPVEVNQNRVPTVPRLPIVKPPDSNAG